MHKRAKIQIHVYVFFRKMSSTMDELAKKLGAEFANLINV
jgi:hypothetical protein